MPIVKSTLRMSRRWHSAASYENYLRLLQNQVVDEGTKLIDGKTDSTAVVEKVPFVTFNQLMNAPEVPKDPVMRFRDLDNVRVLVQKTGSTMHVNDMDCAVLCMDLLTEIKRGRRVTKEIVEIFHKMEAHPDFYKTEHKAYNLMVYNTLAHEYPSLETPAKIFGNMLEKKGSATPWTYICLSRVQMFLPPVERASYRNAFLEQIDFHENAMTPWEAKKARFFIRRLKWITDSLRWTLYALGLSISIFAFFWAVAYRREGRAYRALLEYETFAVFDEQYYGEATPSEGGRPTSVLPGRAGVTSSDVEE
eukprot:TRINITY_DN24409_c0_g1_i1.p1 TRINITY_DN24409_c0_g1~~TRINITY_DN24409_c0_g1_i1.p1  ORF type:complete len:327 (+),score=68.16 TRINITY_DN24409_c0_g1_i1:61-981(+)